MVFDTVAALPDVAPVLLGAILRPVVSESVLPWCAYLNILNLLGKNGGGCRTIATMASLYRLAMRLCGDDLAAWDRDKAGFFDTAVAGSSALRAHLLRALEVELAVAENLSVAHFLWDMEKFYDAIRLTKLVPKLAALGYPAAVANLGLVAHKAPRVLRAGPSFSTAIVGTRRSIIAGCQQSVSWARALLLEFVERLGYVVPGSVCFEHVDDLSQVVTAANGPALRKSLVDIGMAVHEGCRSWTSDSLRSRSCSPRGTKRWRRRRRFFAEGALESVPLRREKTSESNVRGDGGGR